MPQPPQPEARRTAANPPSAVRQSRRASHQRSRSVHFSTEPVARDVQREMEQELQRWVQPALEHLIAFEPSARGAVSVKQCAKARGGQKIVLKSVAMTLPPCRDSTLPSMRSGCHGFSSTDLSSDLSGNLLHPPSEKDSTWSQAQLLPDASVALFNQVGMALPHVAGVVDVFTLAAMLRNTETQPRSGKLEDESSSCDNSKGLVRMPRVSAQEMELRGWAMADAASALQRRRSAREARDASTNTHSGGSTHSSPQSSVLPPSSPPPPPPHPTVFLYARDYVEGVDTLDIILQERWGRDRLPITVLPRWAHCCGPEVGAAGRAEELHRLEEHVARWLSGRAKVEKRKRRLVEERTAAEMSQRGAVFAAPVAADEHRLTGHDAADIIWAAASALLGLHKCGHAHGNLKPNNVLVQQWDSQTGTATPAGRRKVCLTDHLLPLVPDALLEPGAVLSLPGWRTREMRAYACLKPHDASVLPHMLGGGPAGAPPADQAAAYSVSGCWLATAQDASDAAAAVTVEGGVDALSGTAYEAVLLQHFVPPERVLLVLDGSDAAESQVASPVSDAACRVWVNTSTADAAGDVYALGVLLWEMITGRLPPLPHYCRVVRHASGTASLVAAEHAAALPPSHVEVMMRAVTALAELQAEAKDASHKHARRLKELSIFLHSELAQMHLPLILALVRARRDARLVTMDLLLRLLHTDPKHRLTLTELRQHAFFRAYGSRRHELRRQYEAAQRAASLSSRHSMRAPDGRALMPRQMGALAGAPEDTHKSLERCRSEVTTASANQGRRVAAATTAAVAPTTTAVPPDATRRVSGGAAANPPMTRSRSAYAIPSPAAELSPEPCPCPFDNASKEVNAAKLEKSGFLGPASPAVFERRRSSSSNGSHGSASPTARLSSSASPSAAATFAGSPAASFRAAERSLSGRVRTPSLPPNSSRNDDGLDSASQSLARTKTFRGGRRWTLTRVVSEAMMSPLRDDDNVDQIRSAEASPQNTEATSTMAPAAATVPRAEIAKDVSHRRVRETQEGPSTVHEKAHERHHRLLTPKASWVSDVPVPPLLSVPSRRLAPLAMEVPSIDLDKTVTKHPLGPRRPAVRVRPSNS